MGGQRQSSSIRQQREMSRELKAAEKRAKRQSRATKEPKDGTEGLEHSLTARPYWHQQMYKLQRAAETLATVGACGSSGQALPIKGEALGNRAAEFIEQSLGLLQIGGIESFGEPVVDFSQHRAGLSAMALLGEQAG
jgi:hypothetical protein